MKNNQPKKTNDRLGSYLTAALGISTLAGTADAAVVSLNISSIDGKNAGVASNSTVNLADLDPQNHLTGNLDIFVSNAALGLGPVGGTKIANDSMYYYPTKFQINSLISNATSFNDEWQHTLFMYRGMSGDYYADDFAAGSFMGFKSANGHYGYLEVTWDSTANKFEILSGAYESEVGVGILAGATAVPEPASVLTAMSMLASGLLIRRRKQVA